MRPYLLSLRQRTLPIREGAQPILQLYRLHGLRSPRDSLLFFSLACVNMSKISCATKRKVENNGFEPLTPCLQSRCSSQLS